MNRHTTFGSPYLLGFEHLERLLERTARTSGDAYPPYNIEGLEDGGIRITLAVAGFSRRSSASPKRTANWWSAGARLRLTAKRSFTAALLRDNFCAALSWPMASKLPLPRWKMDC